jgi:TP901 family phage tail tape measure protein
VADFLPPVVVQLLADTKEFKAKMADAEHSVTSLGKAGETTGAKMSALGSKLSTGFLVGVGGAMIYGTKLAFDYNESIDKIGVQAGVSAKELEYLHKTVMETSVATATSQKDTAEAYMAVEKAGLRSAAATNLVTAAAKAANITGGKVLDVTNSMIAVQTLHTAKSMSQAQIADVLVNANKRHLGSVTELAAALTGKVGAALASHNVSIKDSLAITDQLSQAHFSNTRAVVTFTNAIGKLEQPNKTMTAQMTQFGVSSDRVRRLMAGPDGLVNTLSYLNDVSLKTGRGAGAISNALFGTGGGAAAYALISNAKTLQATVKSLGGSGTDLNSQFGGWLKLPAGQIAQFKTNMTATLTSLGELLLPKAETMGKWLTSFTGLITKNKLAGGIFDGTLIAGALTLGSLKLLKVVNALRAAFGLEAVELSGAGVAAAGALAIPAAALAMGYKLTHEKLTPDQMKDPRSRWTGGEFGFTTNPNKPSTGKTTFNVTIRGH